jgi:DNA-binding NarL/FixJ family response regulator
MRMISAVVTADFTDVDFSSYGVMTVTFVDDFAAAQVALDVNQPDFLLLTSTLPGFDSASACSALRVLSPTTYVMVQVQDEFEQDAALFGGAHITNLASQPDSLDAALNDVIDGILKDPHRQLADRRESNLGAHPHVTDDRRGVDWGPVQGFFNSQAEPFDE